MDIMSLLIALQLCSSSLDEGVYHVACLNDLPRPPPASDNGDNWKEREEIRHGGVEVRAANTTTTSWSSQLRHVFRQIQQTLWNWNEHCGRGQLTEWLTGSEIRFDGDLGRQKNNAKANHSTVTIELTDGGQALAIVCSGDDPETLYNVINDVQLSVVRVVETCCPGMFVERAPISPRDIPPNP